MAAMAIALQDDHIVGSRDANGKPIELRALLATKSSELGLSQDEISQIRKTTGDIFCSSIALEAWTATGFLIGQGGMVMTNSHALVTHWGGFGGKPSVVSPPSWECFWQNKDTPFRRVPLDISAGGLKIFSIDDGNTQRDVAVARLRWKVPGARPFPINNTKLMLSVGENLTMVSGTQLRMPSLPKPVSEVIRTYRDSSLSFDYNRDLIVQRCSAKHFEPTRANWVGEIYTDCATTGGTSGSPVFARTGNGELVIVAINAAGTSGRLPDFTPYRFDESDHRHDNYAIAVRLSAFACDEIQGFEDQFEKLRVPTVPMSTVARDAVQAHVLGLVVADLTDELRKKYSISETTRGVVILDADSELSKSKPLLKSGSVISMIAQDGVERLADFVALVDKYRARGTKNILFQIRAADVVVFNTVPFDLIDFVARRDRDCLIPYRPNL